MFAAEVSYLGESEMGSVSQLGPEQLVFAGGVVALTTCAAVTDWRQRRIPNALTVPAFVAGLLCQVAFRGADGLLDAGLGFALGFGTLFVLWMIGGAGAGDAKLMGALCVWLGAGGTLAVLVVSTLLVIAGTVLLILASSVGGNSAETAEAAPTADSPFQKVRRRKRLMPYAIPVALAAWAVLGWELLR